MIVHVEIIMFIALGTLHIAVGNVELSYESLRNKVMDTERRAALGGTVWLSSVEEKANSILMNAKREEMAEGLKNPEKYPPAMHFFQGKQHLRQSEVFRIIQKMPKGALFGGQHMGIVSSKWVIGNLTTLYNLHTCRNVNGLLLFTYDQGKCHSEVQSVCTERINAEDQRLYERQLEKHINMYNMHPESLLTDRKKIWQRYENIDESLANFYNHMPTFCVYHKRLLEELCEDNVIYAEIRSPLNPLCGNNNRTYNSLEVATELEKIVEGFKAKHPDFVGLKVIYTRPNKATVDEMAHHIIKFRQMHNARPNFIIGFDLSGQEDVGDPLHKFVNELTDLPPTAHFFFSAGHTNWHGKTDWNLLDALLLNTKRLGHGFALSKHPQLWSTLKKRNIAIEVSPIASQVMGFVWDVRNHPASFLIAENFPVVISASTPGMWNAKGLSYDFYYAFMALAPAEADLRLLKQLALNSIKYAILTSEERRKVNRVFQKKWDEFIYNVINLKF